MNAIAHQRQTISSLLLPLPAVLHSLDKIKRASGCIVAQLDPVVDALLMMECALKEQQWQERDAPDYAPVIARVEKAYAELTLLQTHGDDEPLTLKNRQQDLIAHEGATMTLQQFLAMVAAEIESLALAYLMPGQASAGPSPASFG